MKYAIALFLLLLCACDAQKRQCRKAHRHLARAVWLCPEVLRTDSTTFSITTPEDSATATLPLHAVDTDSLLAACDQLRQALAAERDLYRMAMATPRAVPQAVQRLRRMTLPWAPFSLYTPDSSALVRIRPGPEGRPLVTVVSRQRTITGKAPCPPQVTNTTPSPTRTGVAGWYRWFFWFWVLTALATIACMGFTYYRR